MHRALCWAGAVALLAAVTAAGAAGPQAKDDPPKQQRPPQSAAEKYQAILKEYADAQKAFNDANRQAKTNEEKQKVRAALAPKPEQFAARFLKLAEDHPKDPAAVDALIWVVRTANNTANNRPEQVRAADILLRDHMDSPKLGMGQPALSWNLSWGPNGVQRLRDVVAKSPHREVQGRAAWWLLQQLKLRADRGGTEEQKKEIEALYERIVKDYYDVEIRDGVPFGPFIEGMWNKARNLLVGKVAPDIVGEDIDGVKFKLSDYRGKVVMLDFWGHW
jgi:hypothetical protein